jgi:superfamily II DNA/RNA helicase
LFSATFDDHVEKCINTFLPQCTGYKIEKEALKLKGVRQLKMHCLEEDKNTFIHDIYLTFGQV